jgi:hypothetical protein
MLNYRREKKELYIDTKGIFKHFIIMILSVFNI